VRLWKGIGDPCEAWRGRAESGRQKGKMEGSGVDGVVVVVIANVDDRCQSWEKQKG
jgi:hypothetical protein